MCFLYDLQLSGILLMYTDNAVGYFFYFFWIYKLNFEIVEAMDLMYHVFDYLSDYVAVEWN